MANGRIVIDVELDDTKAMDKLNGLAQAGGKGGGIFGKMFGGAKGFIGAVAGLKAVNGAINLVKNSMGAGISRFDTMNAFPRMMKVMGFTAEQSEKSIQTLSKGIEGLPTALDTVTGTAQQLTMMTGDIGKATDLTLALNNAFLASGASTADASRGMTQYTQMLARGEVDLMSWRTLMETMPVALKQVSEAFGLASDDPYALYDALKSGEITFDEFNNKLLELNDGIGGFAEQARENSKGIATSWQNVKTAVAKGIANMLEAIDNGMIEAGFGSIADNIDRLKGVVNFAFDNMAKGITKFFDVIKKGKPYIDQMGKAFNNLKDSFKAIQDFMSGRNKGSRAEKQLRNQLEKMFSPETVDKIVSGIKQVQSAMKKLDDFSNKISSSIVKNFEKLKDGLGKVVKSIGKLFDGEFATKISKGLNKMARGLSKFFEPFTKIMDNQLSVFKKMADGYAKVLDQISKGDFSGAFDTLKQTITDGLSKSLGNYIDLAKTIYDNILTGIQSVDWYQVASTILNLIGQGFGYAMSFLGDLGSKIRDEIFRQTQSTSWGEVATFILNRIGEALRTAVNMIGDIGSAIKDWIFQNTQSTSWYEVGQFVINKIGEALRYSLDLLGDIGWSICTWIGDQLALVDWGQAASNIILGITRAVDGLGGLVGDIATKIKDWIFEKLEVQSWNEAGQKIIDGIHDGISGAMEKVGEIARDIFDTIMEGISSESASPQDVQGFVDGLLKGIAGAIEFSVSLLASIADAILVGLVNGLVDAEYENIGEAIWDGIKKALIAALDFISVVDDMVADFSAAVETKFQEVGTAIKDAITKGLEDFSWEDLLPEINWNGWDIWNKGKDKKGGDQGKMIPTNKDGFTKEQLRNMGNVDMGGFASSLNQAFRSAFEQVKVTALQSMQGVMNTMKAELGKIGTALTPAMSQMNQAFKQGFEQIKLSAGLSMQGLGLQIQQGLMMINPQIQSAMMNMGTAFRQGFEQIKLSAGLSMQGLGLQIQQGFMMLTPAITASMLQMQMTFKMGFEQIKLSAGLSMQGLSLQIQQGLMMINPIVSTFMMQLGVVFSTGWMAIGLTFTTALLAINAGLSASLNNMQSTISNFMNSAKSTFDSGMKSIQTNISSTLSAIEANFRSSLTAMQTQMSSSISQMVSTAQTGFNNVANAIQQAMNTAVNTVNNAMNQIVSALASGAGRAYTAGWNTGMGFNNGLAASAGAIYSTAYSIANSVSNIISSALRIFSPSRVTRQLGVYTGQGFALGLEDEIPRVEKASLGLANASIANINPNDVAGVSAYGNYSNGTETSVMTQVHIGEFNNNNDDDIPRLVREISWHEEQRASAMLGGSL